MVSRVYVEKRPGFDVETQALLKAYADGQNAVTGAIEHGLNGLPLVGARSPLRC